MIDRQTKRALELMISATELATRQLSQVTRCLQIAILANMRNEPTEALKEISEIQERLEAVEKHMKNAYDHVEAISDAG